MITTKKTRLTSKELFFILVKGYVKKRWWLLLWTIFIGFITIKDGFQDTLDVFIFLLVVLYLILILFQFWRYPNLEDNKLFLAERYYEIEEEKMNAIIDEDTFSTINHRHFIKYYLINEVYLLYLSRNQFIYIPIKSFKSEDDLQWFKDKVLSNLKKK